MRHLTRLRRVSFATILIVLGAVAAVATADDRQAFHAHRSIVAVRCAGGLVADAADGRCVSAGAVEGPIESFVLAEQRALKQTAPFQTVAHGAFANGDLPAMPVVRFSADPVNPNRIIAATYGRGVWAYTFGK